MNLDKTHYSTKDLLPFILPSLVGILLFMTPISYKSEITIPIAILSKFILNNFITFLPAVMTVIMCITGIGSIIAKTLKPSILSKSAFLHALFDISPLWFLSRMIGIVFALCTLFQVGPDWIWSENTGSLLLYDLLPILFGVFLFAGMFLPLLLDFGLLEFFGTLLTKIMRPIFTLPGRSSIDCITSWLGDGTIGVLLTSKQYEEGYYTKREAAVIATNFSAVSITFSLVVISQVNLGHLFVPYYFAITLSGIVAAIIIPRIPPLSKKSNTYYGNRKQDNSEELPKNYTAFPMAWNTLYSSTEALTSARGSRSLSNPYYWFCRYVPALCDWQ